MKLPRFYQHLELVEGNSVELNAQNFRHSVQVLRLREGDWLMLFNGEGQEAQGQLETVSKRGAVVRLGRVDRPQTLEVEIPAGVDTGTRIRLSGKGEAGARGAPPGDLYIFVHLERHPIFEREGTTLFTRAPISFTLAALGGEITIPGLDGTKHDIRIPAGIQSGKQIRQRGAGMPVLRGRGHGDLVIEFEVEGARRAIYGPIIGAALQGHEADELFGHVMALASSETFFELKRSRSGPPQIGTSG